VAHLPDDLVTLSGGHLEKVRREGFDGDLPRSDLRTRQRSAVWRTRHIAGRAHASCTSYSRVTESARCVNIASTRSCASASSGSLKVSTWNCTMIRPAVIVRIRQ